MFSKSFRHALILGGVSAIAISTNAMAATGTAPSNIRFADDAGSDCLIDANWTATGTVDDNSGFNIDFATLDLTDANGNVLAGTSSNVSFGTTQNFNTGFAVSPTTTGTSPIYLDLNDRDGSSNIVSRLGRTQVDLNQMAAAGGACTTLAQNLGFTPAANNPPVADAGADNPNTTPNTIVTLDATGSTDPDGDPLTYRWQQISGRSVTINNSGTATATFTAPGRINRDETLVFQVIVDDPNGGNSTDTVSFTILTGSPPTADAGPDQTVTAGTTVTLNGASSSDPDADPLIYTWFQLAGPPVTLANPSSATPSFTISANAPANEEYRFELEVDDGTARGSRDPSQVDLVSIFVAAPANGTPIADAGPDQTVQRGDNVQLTSAGSTDPDGDTLTYAWSQTGGATVTLSGANSATPTFTAPNVDRRGANLTFEVTATDPSGASATDTVLIAIPFNAAPTPDAGPDQTALGGSTVTLDGTGSTDPEGDPITYSWGQASGTPVTLVGDTTPNPTFVAPAATASPQTLVFNLVALDDIPNPPNSIFQIDQVTITIPAAAANLPPVADAGFSDTILPNRTAGLNGRGSSDPDGDQLTYSWVQVSGPSVTITDANRANASFLAPAQTVAPQPLTFELTVSDGRGGTDSAQVTFTVPGNPAPVADAGADIGPIDSGTTVTLDGSGSRDPSNDPLTYSWVQTSGPAATLSDPASATPSFVAPPVNGTDTLEFELTVSDGLSSATDTVRVEVRALGTVTIITNVVGDDTTVGFTSNVPGLAPSVTTSGGSGTISAQNLAAGNYSLSVNDLRQQGYALTGLTCNDADSTISVSDGTIDISLAARENLVCTVTLTDSRGAAQRAIGAFLGGRNALLLSNEPDLQRRLNRVKGQPDTGGSATIGQVSVPGSGSLPVSLNVTSQSKSVSTSLNKARNAVGRGDNVGSLDIWFEGTLANVTLGDSSGNFLLGYAGMDYLVQEGLLVGALVQFDKFDSDATALGAGEAEGEGWMVGPYVTAKLAPNFYVDARVAFGSSDNTVSPLGTYTDGFATNRLLASSSAIGDIDLGGDLTLWPEVSLRYIREDIESYVDSLGVTIPDERIDQGEIAFSPRLDYRSVGSDGWSFAPYIEVEGLLTFGADCFSVVENGLRGRGMLGLDIASPSGLNAGLAGFYDGIGQDQFEAVGANVSVSITF